MDIILAPLLSLINLIIRIYIWFIIANVILSWLSHFNIINTRNNVIMMVREFLYKVTEPALSRIRRFLPIISGFDLSPLVLILFLWFLQGIIGQLILKILIYTNG